MIGTPGPTDKRPMGVHDVRMPPYGSATRPRALRVAQGDGAEPVKLGERNEERAGDRPSLRLIENASPIVVAGSDTPRRAALLTDLVETLPVGTVFEELGTVAQVLERAPDSRMVILSGGLEDISGKALMRILGQRHPTL